MEQSTKHKILNGLYLLAVIINLAAITLTIYLMANFPVGEGNMIPAIIYDTFGNLGMYLVAIAVWGSVFGFLEFLRRTQGERNMVFLKSGIVVMALFITSIDLIHNIQLYFMVI